MIAQARRDASVKAARAWWQQAAAMAPARGMMAAVAMMATVATAEANQHRRD